MQRRPALSGGGAGLSLLLALTFAVPRAGEANTYSVPLAGIDTEEDLYELYYEGNLEEEELERLLALLQSPVDVNAADREELYDLPGLTWPMVDGLLAAREKQGAFRTLKDLALIPELPPDVLDELAPFAEARQPMTSRDYVRSTWRFHLGYNPSLISDGEDAAGQEEQSASDAPPSFYLASDTEVLRWLTLGFAVTEGQELASPQYRKEVPLFSTSGDDKGEQIGTRPGYLTDGLVTRYDLAKIYLHTPQNRYTRWSVIAGSYRIGFGMGLVFDNTARQFPKGWLADTVLSRSETLTRTTPVRYRDSPGLFGAAATLHRLDVGEVALSGSLFVSRVGRNTYQELNFDVSELDTDSELASDKLRSLYICQRSRNGRCEYAVDPATGKTTHSLSRVTLLDSLTETTVGANVNLLLDAKTQFGLTAYRSGLEFAMAPATALELTTSSKYPSDRTAFGAVGGHFFWGLGDWSARAEAALGDNGGTALWLRGFYSHGSLETELGLRRYDDDYDNPWTSPFAEADEYEGNRARDEMGVNYRVAWRPLNGLQLRLRGDFWRRSHSQCWVTDGEDENGNDLWELEDDTTFCRLLDDLTGRVAFREIDSTVQELSAVWRPLRPLRLTLRGGWADHDLSQGERGDSFAEGPGSKWTLFGQADLQPVRWLRLTAASRVALVDDPGPRSLFDPDLYARYKDIDRAGRTWSTRVVDKDNPDCYDADGVPKYTQPKTCRSLFDDRFRTDFYAYLQLAATWEQTTGLVKFKYYDEAIDYPSVVDSQGAYRLWTFAIKQSKTLGLFAGSLRYDLLEFIDDRVKWYQEDLRRDQNGRLLLNRYNHQLTFTAELSF